jgi:glycosyltransferase involved in cell wall biosynthesis
MPHHKTSILFLTLYDESGASSRLKVYQFLPFIKKAGFEFEVKPLITGNVYQWFKDFAESKNPFTLFRILFLLAWTYRKRVSHVWSANRYDLVFLQKDVLPLGLLTLLKFRCKKLIFDCDDPIWILNPTGGGNTFLGKIISAYRTHLLNRVLKFSKIALVDNPLMKKYALKYCKRAEITNSAIDVKSYRVIRKESRESVTRFGWVGSPSTTYLLLQLIPLLEALSEKFPLCLYNIGSGEVYSSNFKIHNIAWTPENEREYLGYFDIGLQTNDDNPFNLARYSRKWILYGIAGIPTLASDNGLNPECIIHGKNGLLYNPGSQLDFIEKASELIENPELRTRLGGEARKKIERDFDLPVVADFVISLLKSL